MFMEKAGRQDVYFYAKRQTQVSGINMKAKITFREQWSHLLMSLITIINTSIVCS